MNTILSKQYTVTRELYEKGFIAFQKKFVYPKNIILSAAYAAFAAFNIFYFVKDGSLPRIIFAAVFAGIAVSLWTGSKSVRRKFLDAISSCAGLDIYKIDVFDDKILISTLPDTSQDTPGDDDDFFSSPSDSQPIEPSELRLDNSYLKAVEKEDFIMLYLVRSVFFIVPKNAFSSDELDSFTALLKNALGKKYYS